LQSDTYQVTQFAKDVWRLTLGKMFS